MPRLPQARSVKTVEAILAAAERLLAREGLSRLTLDGVVAEAGISKGGLQHHFRSKEALVAALVSRKMAAIQDGMAAEEQALGTHPDRAAIAMIRHSAQQWDDKTGFPPALLAAAVLNSQSLHQVGDFLAARLERARSETDKPDQTMVLVFASLGLLLTTALGLVSIDIDEGRRLFKAMERIANKPE